MHFLHKQAKAVMGSAGQLLELIVSREANRCGEVEQEEEEEEEVEVVALEVGGDT